MAKKEVPAAEGAGPAEGKGRGKLKLIILLVLALLLTVGVSVGATWFLLGKRSATPEAAPVATAPAHQPALYQPLVPAFVVNYRADGRQRYMQVSVTLMGRDQAQLDALKAQLPQVRNQLVMLFTGQDFANLVTPVGKEMLRQQATSTVQELAKKLNGNTTIEQVLFTNFVLQ